MTLSTSTTDRPFVLLTGATGLVGGHVLARLLSCGIDVAVLIRGQRRRSARQRLDELMVDLEQQFGRLFERPVLLEGELCKPGLGLSSEEHRWLSEYCGSVIHCAASISFRPASAHPQREPFRTNVEGTRSLLTLMSDLAIREWHHVSTAYVAGTRHGLVAEEDSLEGRDFGNDYESSKAQAELMLRQSDGIDSLTVYRPSIVLEFDSKATPRADQTISQTFSVYRSLASEFGLPGRGALLRSLALNGNEGKNLVSASWVGRLIAEIWRHPDLHGRTYHLTNQMTVSVSQLEDSFYSAVETLAAESQKSGTDIRGTAKVADWSGIEALAAPFVAAFQPYFRDDPKFGRVSTEKALGRLGIADQPQPSLEELRQFCVSSTRIAPSQDTANRAQEDLVALPEYSSVAAWSRRENPWSDATSSRLIIQLVGHDGGVWDISESEVHPCSAHDAARFVAFVTTASVWNVLCRHPEQLDEMLRKGSLLIERTVHEFGSAVSSVDEAIERLRRCLRKIAERLSLVPDSEEAGNVR